MIAGILLAAGAGRRFGAQKLLEALDETPLVCATVAACLQSRLDEIVVVTGPDASVSDALHVFGTESRLRYATNDDPARGLMSSLKVGLRSLAAAARAAMVIHADMPRVPARTIDQLVLEYSWHGGIVIPVCAGHERHPRIIPRDLFDEFLALPDDARGTTVIDRYRADVTLVSFANELDFMDIDVPQDMDAWRDANQAGH